MSGLLPCVPPWEATGGARGMLGFLHWQFFQYTRYGMGFSTYVDPSCASNKLLCSLSAENSTANNLTPPGPLPDLREQQRSTASRSFNHHHVRSGTNYSAA